MPTWTPAEYRAHIEKKSKPRLKPVSSLGEVSVGGGKTRLKIKLLSINRAWKGRRFKTPEYVQFQKSALLMLPKLEIPPKPYEVHYRYGFSSKNSDLLNPEKLITDILCKKYGFDDRYIVRMVLEKELVEKGMEFFEFQILTYKA